MTALSPYSSNRKPSQARGLLQALAYLSLRARLIFAFLLRGVRSNASAVGGKGVRSWQQIGLI
jgi:hypothetical protein